MSSAISGEIKKFNYLSSEIDAAYHEASQRLGLSDSAMQILYAVYSSAGECLLSDVWKLSGISRQTINSSLRKLESEGIVYLEAAEGKKKKVCLTEKGKELSERTAARLIRVENEIFDSWGERELELYLEFIQKYLISFKEKIKEF